MGNIHLVDNNLKQNQGKTNKNYCILLFEIIACIFIVFLHIKFPSVFGDFVEMFARFGVPFFFMVSGYFLISNHNQTIEQVRKKLKKRLLKLSIIFVLSSVLYFCVDIYFNRNSVNDYFINIFNIKRIFAFLLFNEPLFGGHLWFILSLMYSYIFIFIFTRAFIDRRNQFWLYFFSFVLIINIVFSIITSQFNYTVFGIDISHYWFYRNWLVEGLPFVSLGILLSKKKELFLSIKTNFIITILVSSFVLMIFEGLFYRKVLHSFPVFCFFNIVFCVLIFALSIKKPSLLSKCFLLNIPGNWTTYVYIIHPLFIQFTSSIFVKISFSGLLASFLQPILVAFISILFSILLSTFLFAIKHKLMNRH